VSRGTLDPALLTRLSLTGLSPSLAGFPKTILLNLSDQLRGPNPGMHAFRFGLFRFRSPLLTESLVVFSSSGYLDVSVHRVPFHTLWIGVWMTGVCPAGYLLLPEAFRSLSRLSSALSAKASTLRSF
jgi:hypothetical protein